MMPLEEAKDVMRASRGGAAKPVLAHPLPSMPLRAGWLSGSVRQLS